MARASRIGGAAVALAIASALGPDRPARAISANSTVHHPRRLRGDGSDGSAVTGVTR